MNTCFVSRYSSTPQCPSSRPNPLILYPPHGASTKVGCMWLTHTIPASSALTTRKALKMSRVHTAVVTHSHPDHTNGNERALSLTGAAFAAHPMLRPSVPLEDGGTLSIGHLRLTAQHVPGHCADHLVLYESVHRLLISGDLLFVGNVGGTDNDSDARAEWRSRLRLFAKHEGPVRRTLLRALVRLGLAWRALADRVAEACGRLSAEERRARRSAYRSVFSS